MNDRDFRGRNGMTGTNGGKLSYEIAEQIRAEFNSNADIPELAEKYNVHPKSIFSIIKYRTYTRPDARMRRRLTDAQVRDARRLRATTSLTIRSIAEEVNAPYAAIKNVFYQGTYKDVA